MRYLFNKNVLCIFLISPQKHAFLEVPLRDASAELLQHVFMESKKYSYFRNISRTICKFSVVFHVKMTGANWDRWSQRMIQSWA